MRLLTIRSIAMPDGRVAASFRDPSGFVYRHEGRFHRQISRPFADAWRTASESGFFEAAMAAGELVRHESVALDAAREDGHPITDDAIAVIRPDALPFISHPYEWSFSQLKDAALLTLSLQKRALDHGLWLKDASAYNVQFVDDRPIFIDTLSFEPYPAGEPWVAYQQFCRHFLAPLALIAHVHVDLSKLLRVHIDGVPLDLASRALPFRTRFKPGLLIHLHMHARTLATHADRPESAGSARARGISEAGLRGLVDSLESLVEKLDWKPTGTEWGDYYDATNYTDESMGRKAEVVTSFIERVDPKQVWDLGANTGRFSRLASQRGIFTVAADIDPAAVETNYREIRNSGERHLLPLVFDLTNPSPALGWDLSERESLPERGPVDLVLALALVHHLAIGNNVPLDRVARFMAGLARNLVIEFVPKSDSQVERLLATRADVFPDYTSEGFEAAFAAHFELVEAVPIEGSERTVYLFERTRAR